MPLDTQTPIVFVLGGPGTGKSTQCQLLEQHFNFRHLSAGQLLREHIALGTEDGNLVAQLIENGKIVPSKVRMPWHMCTQWPILHAARADISRVGAGHSHVAAQRDGDPGARQSLSD